MMHLAKAASVLGFEGFFHHNQAPTQMHEKFAAHMEAEGLSYGTRDEYEFRFGIYQQVDYEIEIENNKQDSYRLGHNMFSTMTKAEANKMLGAIPQEMDAEPATFDESSNGGAVDWRSKGGVNSVKNQGSCGSCWAFGATAGTEHSHWRAARTLQNLSEQQLVDCST